MEYRRGGFALIFLGEYARILFIWDYWKIIAVISKLHFCFIFKNYVAYIVFPTSLVIIRLYLANVTLFVAPV